VRFWHAFQVAYQKVIEPLARGIGIDLDQAGRRRACRRGAVGWRFGPYNVFHLRVAV
jgi:hypothetical protein